MVTEYKKTVLPDGLKIISESVPTVRSISIGLWLDIGSRDEAAELNGVCHLIEHMAFKGTDSRSAHQIALYLESVGGVLNAFTSREQTCFYAKIIDEHLPRAVEVLADIVFNSRFDAPDIEKEKNIIIDEINEVNDTPADLVHDLFAQSVFAGHSLGRPILGSSETVQNISRDEIIGHVKKYYQRPNIIVAASGNLKHEALVDLVEKHFPETNNDDCQKTNRTEPRLFPGLNFTTRDTNQAHICIGAPAINFDHPQRPALLLLNSIIGGGMSSRLYQKIRENMGLAYTVFSYLDFFVDTSIIGIYLNTEKKHTSSVISVVLKELSRLKDEKLDPSELERAKEQLKGSLVLGLENTSNRMNRMAKHELLLGRYITVDESISDIERITASEVQELASEMFLLERFSVTVLGPVSKDTVDTGIVS